MAKILSLILIDARHRGSYFQREIYPALLIPLDFFIPVQYGIQRLLLVVFMPVGYCCMVTVA